MSNVLFVAALVALAFLAGLAWRGVDEDITARSAERMVGKLMVAIAAIGVVARIFSTWPAFLALFR